MGDAADDLTNDMIDAYAMHLQGICGGDCEWCIEEGDYKEGYRENQAGRCFIDPPEEPPY